MRRMDRTKSTTKQSDKTHILIRFGKNTIIEYYNDISRRERRIVLFNVGWRS
jgi:hypothetical protein